MCIFNFTRLELCVTSTTTSINSSSIGIFVPDHANEKLCGFIVKKKERRGLETLHLDTVKNRGWVDKQRNTVICFKLPFT